MAELSQKEAHFCYILALADDHLILSHRLSLWCGHAPTTEDDLALPNIALDMLGHSEMLYQHAKTMDGNKRDEDQLAYLREEDAYLNFLLVERATEHDFAQTIIQLIYFCYYMRLFWQEARNSNDEILAQIATRALKETAYHIRYAKNWAITLGHGTQESQQKMNDAIIALYPYTAELFLDNAEHKKLPDIAVSCKDLQNIWQKEMAELSQQIGLDLTPDALNLGHRTGGRQGNHSEQMGYLLAELQFIQRSYPNMSW